MVNLSKTVKKCPQYCIEYFAEPMQVGETTELGGCKRKRQEKVAREKAEQEKVAREKAEQENPSGDIKESGCFFVLFFLADNPMLKLY